jgi:hypothetical protein
MLTVTELTVTSTMASAAHSEAEREGPSRINEWRGDVPNGAVVEPEGTWGVCVCEACIMQHADGSGRASHGPSGLEVRVDIVWLPIALTCRICHDAQYRDA